MFGHVNNMIDSFMIKLNKDETTLSPAGDNFFDEGTGNLLDKNNQEQFHTTAAKGLYICKRGPDIQLVIAVLCTRVQKLNESDWKTLIRLI